MFAKKIKVAFIMLCIGLFIAGCNKSAATQNALTQTQSSQEEKDNAKPEDKDKLVNKEGAELSAESVADNVAVMAEEGSYVWLIKIEQKNTAPFLGDLSGGEGSELLFENTMNFVAYNDNESPYEGVFKGYATIMSYADAKEQMGVDTTDYLEFKNEHEAQNFTFTLVPREKVASLTRDKSLDMRLEDYAEANFLMPTKGDNPAAVFGSAEGFGFAINEKLDFALTCMISQHNGKIELKTDMFGKFTGTIERVKEEGVDLAPLPVKK